MSLFIETYQYSWGAEDRPQQFGYYLSCWDESTEEAPFPSRAARSAYEDAVHAYATEHAIAGDPYVLAACMTVIRDGQQHERDFARDLLEHEEIEIDDEHEDDLKLIVDRFRAFNAKEYAS